MFNLVLFLVVWGAAFAFLGPWALAAMVAVYGGALVYGYIKGRIQG
ncbi:hypothetical protein DSS3P1_24 [Ruegeria phage DSS3-P1]|nr:hypothetical protein DSS3P1_24 [Ruegeria phage DSS3-P1]YP_009997241.1 hypothetical protein JT312_gp24 [Ruegeria phage vB_RpoS-V18]YP_009997323.1 hypothetical protein JT313_gp24 [Ruegeria phage vB_RpoS-V11]YP_009997406.1 hypothetical protein JT314_gp25 [Ruegeria phage vB_RpoS-V7]AIT13259.1 hypothetical protein DSS3P1_24 [Ruegeria phage DSS3-P1]AWY08728.1 hypothetical protein vBRpoSV7_25 [Ruegeria phage vB_RpoS-V7]AWY08900.1 hypothetical protein vBRpoSV18_24 [Ruegeria phage vB_RpoS-V18]AWY0